VVANGIPSAGVEVTVSSPGH